MLATIPGYWPVGESVFVWERGLQRNDRCGCGTRFRDCDFWKQVGDAGFGGWGQVDVHEAVRLRATVGRHRNLDRISGLRGPGKLGAAITAYTELTGRLYQAVLEVSGASVVVDSSKLVSYALTLRDIPGFDMRLLHLIRRSHGVAHSWSKKVRKPGVGDGSGFMSVHSLSWAVGLWIADNLLYDALGRRMSRATRVRYEELMANPRQQLLRVLADLGLPAPGPGFDFLADGFAALPATHAISGNPMRFQRGNVTLRVDDEWRTGMSRARRIAISAATWPLLRHYGYAPAVRGQPGGTPAEPKRRTGP